MAQTLEHYQVNELYFDVENPRLVEFNITTSTPEKRILIMKLFMLSEKTEN